MTILTKEQIEAAIASQDQHAVCDFNDVKSFIALNIRPSSTVILSSVLLENIQKDDNHWFAKTYDPVVRYELFSQGVLGTFWASDVWYDQNNILPAGSFVVVSDGTATLYTNQ